ncbi:site-specific integrase [Mesorhizobium sp. M0854]|uniref:tyrosine-type recombinase/integrase n=1 Tax=Mesorhizobium sp. M0854 TaxID=2957013 RepID=UPI0033386348
MLEFYFSYRGVLKRLRSGALGGEMDRIAKHFFTLGYKRASAKIYLSRIARFSQFAGPRSGPMPIRQDVIDSYLCTFTTDTPRIGAGSALGHARRVAPERFIVSVPSVEDDPVAPLLASFSDYLRRVRGLEPKTREGVLLGGRRFLDWFRHHHPGQDLEALTAEHVLAAVEHRLSLSATSATRTAAISHIRTFLRFLCWAGHHEQDLARVVPRTPHWRLAHLPPRLAWDDVRRAIDAIGATTPVDIRDRAVLLLLATTGIRNGELRAIRLQDIDWRAGEVFVRRTKGKRDRVAPLLEETGATLADYILRARPKVDSPYLFLSFTPPVGPFKCASPVSRIVRKRLRHGGVELGRVAGAHLLRHSLATQLVRQ